MKLLKSLSFLSLPIMTVSFAHAFDNDWGQWQDDSFQIEAIESFNDQTQESLEKHRKKNSKQSNLLADDFNDNFEQENKLDVLQLQQRNDNILFEEPDIADYEDKGRTPSIDTQPSFDLSDLDTEFETPEFESDLDFLEDDTTPSNDTPPMNENIETPEFDYQEYEYNKEIPEEETP